MMKKNTETVRCLILGGGPAGYTAAIYAARANLAPVLYEGMEPGGQLTTTTMVENFPGFENGVDANTLMASMRAQAASFGAEIRTGTATAVDLSERPFRVTVDGSASDPDAGTVILAEALVIATGATARYLGLPSEAKYRGMGVSACATCDGFFYRKRTVAVVGGGDTACEEALYLAGLAKKVYMIVRRDVFRASKAMQDRVFAKDNIEILWNCNTQEVLGDGLGVTGVRLLDNRTLYSLAGDRPERVHRHARQDLRNGGPGRVRGGRCPGSPLPPGGDGRGLRLHGRPRCGALPA